MNKNIITILLIFLVPLCAYWGLTKDKSFTSLPSEASQGPEIVKFASPMCYECIELDKIFGEVYSNYSNKIALRKIDVTQRNKVNQKMIQEYQVRVVPTTVFKNKDGQVTRRIEGSMQPKILENYIREAINE